MVARCDKMIVPCFTDHLYLQTPANGSCPRRAPNHDKEAVTGCMEAFQKIAIDVDEERVSKSVCKILVEERDLFTPMDAVPMDAIDWQSMYVVRKISRVTARLVIGNKLG